MAAPRILIVEPDRPFALSLAGCLHQAGLATEVAGGAGDAELALAARPPDLLLLRAELPDLSGFSLCARLRQGAAPRRLPVLLYSSETGPAALEAHARTPYAASAYLAMPFETGALTAMVGRLLAAAEPALLEEDQLVEVEPPANPGPPRGAPAPGPPRLPRRERRDAITPEDRAFLARTFGSVGDRRAELAAEAGRGRPPPRRDLLATPEGRLSLLRDDLRWREAQLARLAELWEVRDREVAGADERVHAAAVEAQRALLEAELHRGQVADLRARLQEAERAHGAALDGLLQEKAREEKELIEVVAATERRVHEAEGRRQEDVARLEALVGGAEARAAALERQLAERDGQLAEARHAAQWAAVERQAEQADAAARQRALEEALAQALAEKEEALSRLAALEAADRPEPGPAVGPSAGDQAGG